MFSQQKIPKAKAWWMAFRYHFVPPSIFPAVVGSLVSWATNSGFILLYFLFVLFAVIINHVGLNMTDDYFDYKHSVDKLKPGEKNPYTGGSGTLSSGLLAPRSMFNAFVLCYLITVCVGIVLTITRGWPVLAFGLFGVFCAVFYTAPPISFGHHGLGEVAMLINFGPIIGLGAFYVQAQSITLQAFLATLPMGIMLFSMIAINEIPDIDEDLGAGKRTLVARWGKLAGVKLYVGSWICTYTVIVVSVAFGILPLFTLLTLLSLPLVVRSIKTLKGNYKNPKLMAPANLDMIKAHSIAGFGLIGGYAIQGLMNGANAFQLLFILILLIVVYSPVAWMLIKQ